MTIQFPGALERQSVPVLARHEAVALATAFDAPTLVMDADSVSAQYRALARGLGRSHIHYAVKANPAPELVARLKAEGAGFDAASRGEIALCLGQGVAPDRISFGNTIKRASDIGFAHGAGITLFAADAAEEIDKIAALAPGASVYIRLLVGSTEADWPLSRKFGCDPEMALALMDRARAVGLRPVGLSFHVGSQTREAAMWGPVLDDVARVWRAAQARGFGLTLLNIGGGFPADYGQGALLSMEAYAAKVLSMVRARFGDKVDVMAEPGRGMVAEAGAIACEVLLVARKSSEDLHRWVYLDIGKFGGLAETMDEAIRYPLLTPHDGLPTGPCVVAGPTCDSADVMYERQPMALPLALSAGDKVLIRNAGAYTSSYASVGFNGFPPLDVVFV